MFNPRAAWCNATPAFATLNYVDTEGAWLLSSTGGASDNEIAQARGTWSWTTGDNCVYPYLYFEVEVVRVPPDGVVTLGLCPPFYSTTAQPGSQPEMTTRRLLASSPLTPLIGCRVVVLSFRLASWQRRLS
jgi:hypothetical protein